MAEIKTREKVRDIKVPDKSPNTGKRMKDAYIRQKKTEQGSDSASEERNSSHIGKPSFDESTPTTDNQKARAFNKARVIRRRAKQAAFRVAGAAVKAADNGQNESSNYAEEKVEAAGRKVVRSVRHGSAYAVEKGRELFKKRRQRQQFERLFHAESQDPQPAQNDEKDETTGNEKRPVRPAAPHGKEDRNRSTDHWSNGQNPNELPKETAPNFSPKDGFVRTNKPVEKIRDKANSVSVRPERQRNIRIRSASQTPVETAKTVQNRTKNVQQTSAAVKKLTESTGKAVKELISAIAAGGGLAALVVVLMVAIAGAIFASPLGILFADKNKSEDTVSLATAILQVSSEYRERIEAMQHGDYDAVEISGRPAPWNEVIAVFATKTAGGEAGLDVMTLDAKRVSLLKQVFWDMTDITTRVETSTSLDENGEESESKTLHITVAPSSADDMRLEYRFDAYQNGALDFLLENLDAFDLPMGDLEISQEDAIALLENLPDDLSPERRCVVMTALSLVGKVSYFWGGKSTAIGWDDRWGLPMEVTAEGNATTGTIRPFGLDCSGFVDWVFWNASDGTYLPGRGGGTISQHNNCTDIPWSEAQPGDLVFYADDCHVGIVGGYDENGNLLIIHCGGASNGVHISGSVGFTQAVKTAFFDR